MMRRTAIEGSELVNWGTHLCYFYSSADDLLNTVGRYVKAGLESHEYVLWITSAPINEARAIHALDGLIASPLQFVRAGQLEIVPHTSWYLSGGAFDADRVFRAWRTRLDHARERGYDGIRVTGNPSWLQTKEEWSQFHVYERSLSESMTVAPMLALCTYAVEPCTEQLAKIAEHHHLALPWNFRAMMPPVPHSTLPSLRG